MSIQLANAIEELLLVHNSLDFKPDLDEYARIEAVYNRVAGLALAAGFAGVPPLSACGIWWHANGLPVSVGGSAARLAWRAALEQLKIAAETRAGEAPPRPVRQRRRRRARAPKPAQLTEKELEALEIVAVHKGNVSAAARACGKSPTAMRKLYRKANTKLSRLPLPKPRTQALPRDERGQETVAAKDEIDD